MYKSKVSSKHIFVYSVAWQPIFKEEIVMPGGGVTGVGLGRQQSTYKLSEHGKEEFDHASHASLPQSDYTRNLSYM